jgi:glutaredoxin
MDERITVISKNNCQACVATKRYLEQEGVKFNEFNINSEVNEETAAQVVEALKIRGFQGLPVVVVDDNWESAFSGFRPDQLKLL